MAAVIGKEVSVGFVGSRRMTEKEVMVVEKTRGKMREKWWWENHRVRRWKE